MKTTMTIAAALLVAGCGDDTTNNYYPVEAAPAEPATPGTLPVVEKPVTKPEEPAAPTEPTEPEADRPGVRRGRP